MKYTFGSKEDEISFEINKKEIGLKKILMHETIFNGFANILEEKKMELKDGTYRNLISV